MSSLATRVLQLDLRGQLPPRHAPGDFTTPVETNAPPVSSSAARLWGPKLTKSWQRTLPNDANVTAIFLNSHARPGPVPEPFSCRCRPAAGCGAGGSQRVPDRCGLGAGIGGHRWDPAAVFLGGDRPVPAAPRLSSVGGAAIAPAGPFPAAHRARGQRQAILNVGPGKTTED